MAGAHKPSKLADIDALADTYLLRHVYAQSPMGWTNELDLRPFQEEWTYYLAGFSGQCDDCRILRSTWPLTKTRKTLCLLSPFSPSPHRSPLSRPRSHL
eukprot:469892-Prymnesium_polylepis.1